MKVGILTLTPKDNYGGILQAVALRAVLERLGHDVVLINKKPERSRWKALAIRVLEALPLQNIRGFRSSYIKGRRHKEFIRSNLPKVSEEIVSIEGLRRHVDDAGYDAVVVGSDQVWRYKYINNDGNYLCYFLGFEPANPLRKISYAASFGHDYWEAPSRVSEVKDLLREFQSVSVRESSGVSICRDSFGFNNAEVVLDPTALIGAQYFEQFVDAEPVSGSSFVTYVLDNSEKKRNIIKVVGAHFGVSAFDVSEVSVSEWLSKIKAADIVVTDSFHGMVFSILFNKRFLVVCNDSRGRSRFESMLDLVGMRSRLISENSRVSDFLALMSESVDYDDIDKRLELLRKESMRFLVSSLSD